MFVSAALALTLASSWVVLPVHSTNPPPQDPTLLRLTKTLAESIHESVDGDVRVATREERDERCPQEDGHCPNELAALIGEEHAVVLVLDAKYASLQLKVYRGRIGVEREGTIPCHWERGAVACEVEQIAPIFADAAGPNPLQAGEIDGAFAKMKPRLDKCRAGSPVPPEAWISFKVRPDGRVYDVRIDPKELGDDRGFNCIATAVESMKVRRFSGEVQSVRYNLLPEPEKVTKPVTKQTPKKKKVRAQ